MDDLAFKDAIAEALNEVMAATGETIEQLFGEGTAFTRSDLSGEVARSVGYLEGAASALDVTIIGLLDSLGLPEAQ